MPDLRTASVRQLAHKLKGYGKHPRFAFFLGAGASHQSGVITASEMIRYFRERIWAECCPEELRAEEEREKWLSEQEWYKDGGSEYSKLFEQYEPKELGRQRYIESIIENHEPSFGYVVLANLMASSYVNTIITTNFDDLVYSACTSYTGIRPIVYAYGVLASEMRVTTPRPKILKLHGDYLYSTIRNTHSEIERPDEESSPVEAERLNMSRQVKQLLSEYGLVVVGYSGGDESVMRILLDISEKNDLYWCVRRGDEPNATVKNLLLKKKGFIVEIDGFDQMMNEIRKIVGFDVGQMFGSIQERQDQMVEKLKNFAPGYSVDILGEVVEALQKQANEEQEKIRKVRALDLFTKARKAQLDKDLKTAEEFYRQAIDIDPGDAMVYYNLGILYNATGRREKAEDAYRRAIELNPNYTKAYNNLGLILRWTQRHAEAEAAYRQALRVDSAYLIGYYNLIALLRLQGRDAEALPLAERVWKIDSKSIPALLALAALRKKLGAAAEAAQYAARLREIVPPGDFYSLANLEAIDGNDDAAIENLRRASQSASFNREWAKIDPDFELLRDDPRFKAVVSLDGVDGGAAGV
jgi:tetratricopeptide (TPR) repeat protein